MQRQVNGSKSMAIQGGAWWRGVWRALIVLCLCAGLLYAGSSVSADTESTLTVNTAGDVFDVAGKDCTTVTIADLPGLDGATSLREAICASNNTAAGAPHTIAFSIGSGVQTITPASSLPKITRPVTIDGTGQPGYAGTPLIVLDGNNSVNEGLWITAGLTTVRGLVIQRFFFSGIFLGENGQNTIQGNYIGVDASGSQGYGNLQGVVVAVDSPDNLIGGGSAGQGNLISANTWAGLVIDGDNTLVRGNRIGTNAAGTAALGNYGSGIDLLGTGNSIGGPAAGDGNLISGNFGNGIFIGGSNNGVIGNRIGTDFSGTAGVPNQSNGLYLRNASGNVIGAANLGAGNLISGNQNHGVFISGYQSTDNRLYGNQIGTDAAGSARLPNGWSGVWIDSSPGNTVGGAAAGEGNLVSGNTAPGIVIAGHLASGNQVLGNKIGTNAVGTASLYNGMSGIYLASAPQTIIGGAASGAGNLISGNQGNGIYLAAGYTTVQGNKIGTNVGGTAALPNQRSGVYIYNVNDNIVGGLTSGEGNLISGNMEAGLVVEKSNWNQVLGNKIGTNGDGTGALGNGLNGLILDETYQTVIEANLISGNDGYGVYAGESNYISMDRNYLGTNAAGSGALPNTYGGVVLFDARFNRIGTSQGNLISGNGGPGVLLSGFGANNNQIAYNKIGVDLGGSLALGNLGNGIMLWHAPGNTIGGPNAGQGNRIAANGGVGVQIYGDEADDNFLSDNQIGLGANGSPLGNSREGVLITEADGNVIGVWRGGDFSFGRGNTISQNGRSGVGIVGEAVSNNLLQNAIFDNDSLGIDLGANGLSEANDVLDVDAGPNLFQNVPELSALSDPSGETHVQGTLHSAASTLYSLDFYASATCDPTGHGEGQQWLGEVQMSTFGGGWVNFTVNLEMPLPAGKNFVTATATDPDGNTSEFSPCLEARQYIYLPFVRR